MRLELPEDEAQGIWKYDRTHIYLEVWHIYSHTSSDIMQIKNNIRPFGNWIIGGDGIIADINLKIKFCRSCRSFLHSWHSSSYPLNTSKRSCQDFNTAFIRTISSTQALNLFPFVPIHSQRREAIASILQSICSSQTSLILISSAKVF